MSMTKSCARKSSTTLIYKTMFSLAIYYLKIYFHVKILSILVKTIAEIYLQNLHICLQKSSYLSHSWRIVVTSVRWARYLYELQENVYVCYVNLTYEYGNSISPNSREDSWRTPVQQICDRCELYELDRTQTVEFVTDDSETLQDLIGFTFSQEN